MTVRITINTGNAAFEPEPSAEVARILRSLANRLNDEGWGMAALPRPLIDLNGNTVGKAWLEAERSSNG